jgi:hypothetical protein
MLAIAGFILVGPVWAYGESENGSPSWDQREMHTVTNLVRVDPLAWANDYDCSTKDFKADEKQSKAPLYLHLGLTDIAQQHSDDMKKFKFMAHESSDGTEFGDRVWPYYDGTTIGENVAKGYTNNWEVVIEGWMCSAGHRVNIMAADFEDLGTGIAGKFHTQDFGGGAGTEHEPLAMGVHSPKVPKTGVTFYTTWEDNKPPASLRVETDTVCEELELFVGNEERGGFRVEMDDEPGCVPYRFLYEESNGRQGALPTTGSWLYGKNCEDWIEAAPVGCVPPEPEPEPEPDPEDECDLPPELERNGDCVEDGVVGAGDAGEKNGILGCSSGGGAVGGAVGSGWIFALGVVIRRRRFTKSCASGQEPIAQPPQLSVQFGE